MARVHVHAGPVTISSGGKKNGGSGIGTVIVFLFFIVAFCFAIFPPLGLVVLVLFFVLGIMVAIGSVLPDPPVKEKDTDTDTDK